MNSLTPLTSSSSSSSLFTSSNSHQYSTLAFNPPSSLALTSSNSVISLSNPNVADNYLTICRAKSADIAKWRTRVSFLQSFLSKGRDVNALKEQLFEAIAPLDRGAEATPEDQQRVDQLARQLESVNAVKEPLKSNMLNGKWELIYTTSQSVLQTKRPKFLRPNGSIYQAINTDTLRAQNMETWPFFNQATANLVPLNPRRVAVKFDYFRIAGVIHIKSPGSGRGQLEITYLDGELRISRGDRGNLFILKLVDPSYRVPL